MKSTMLVAPDLTHELKHGALPWYVRLRVWWHTKIRRKPLVTGELGQWGGVRIIDR